jgi:hypothetical protein
MEQKKTIKGNDRLLRRAFFKDPTYVRDDMTATSFAFKPRKKDKGLSVDVERLTTYDKSIQDVHRFRLYALIVGYVEELDLEPTYCPLEGNPAHAEIRGKFTNSICSKLAKSASLVSYP